MCNIAFDFCINNNNNGTEVIRLMKSFKYTYYFQKGQNYKILGTICFVLEWVCSGERNY